MGPRSASFNGASASWLRRGTRWVCWRARSRSFNGASASWLRRGCESGMQKARNEDPSMGPQPLSVGGHATLLSRKREPKILHWGLSFLAEEGASPSPSSRGYSVLQWGLSFLAEEGANPWEYTVILEILQWGLSFLAEEGA